MNTLAKYLICIVAFVSNMNAFSQGTEAYDDCYFDSLARAQQILPDDTAKLKILDWIAANHYSVDSVAKYATTLLSLSDKIHSPRYRSYAMTHLAWVNYEQGNNTQALNYAMNALSVADSAKLNENTITNNVLIGLVYAASLNMTKADEFFHNALDRAIEVNDTTRIITIYTNLADSHCENGMFNDASSYYQKALEYAEKFENDYLLSSVYYGLGYVAYSEYKNESIINSNDSLLVSANSYLERAYDIAQKSDIDVAVVQASSFLVSSSIKMASHRNGLSTSQLNKFQTILQEAYSLIEKNSLEAYRIEVDFAWIEYLLARKQYRSAEIFADSLFLANSENVEDFENQLGDMYDLYTRIYEALGRKSEALHSSELSKYWLMRKRSNNYAVTATQSIAQAQFDEQMRQREIETKQNEVRLEEAKRRQTIISIASIVVLILVSLLALTIMANYRRQKRNNLQLNLVNSELELQKLEIEKQNDIINKANQEITDSINYASYIQEAAMPTAEQLQSIFGNYMLFYRPLNIVSGDYYWATSMGNVKMLVVADCTGHGVPGAFVSMLGISILNDIVANMDTQELSAGAILNEMRATFKKMLKQNGNDDDNRDGMDLALIVIECEKNIIHYAGAFRPLIMIRNGEATKFDADRMPIGSHILDKQPFNDNVIEYQNGDRFYMFSDGITDQFGIDDEGRRKKFTAKRLNSLLAQTYHLSFAEQHAIISETIDKWRHVGNKDECEQTDDNILFGIEV